MMLCLGALTYPLAAQKTTTKKTTTSKTTTTTKPAARMSANDSLSYAIGLQSALYYKSQGITNLNPEMCRKAIMDVLTGKPTLLNEEQMGSTIQAKLQAFMANKSNGEKTKGKTFLAANKKRAGVVELPNGLQYEILKAGTGEKPTAQDTVKAHYRGTLIDGTPFDNSYDRGEPLTIPVGGVIQGWVQALQMMPVGSKWKLFIPSDLAYGDRGAGNGQIPGGATLIFEIELLDLIKAQK